MKSKKLNFEEKLNELQMLIDKLQNEDESIEKKIEYYEQGMELVAECRTFLKNAENKIIDISNKYAADIDKDIQANDVDN